MMGPNSDLCMAHNMLQCEICSVKMDDQFVLGRIILYSVTNISQRTVSVMNQIILDWNGNVMGTMKVPASMESICAVSVG